MRFDSHRRDPLGFRGFLARLTLITLLPLVLIAASPSIVSAAEYTVQSGDTLGEIAQRHYASVTFLAQANGIGSPDEIIVGQRLWVPSNRAQANPPPKTDQYVFPLANYPGPVPKHWGGRIGASDLLAPLGSPIFAVQAGRVVALKYLNPQSGNAVQIAGVDGRQYYYSHMVAYPTQRLGQHIAAGQWLGDVGETGDAAAPHLHFAIGDRITTGIGGDSRAGYGTNFNVTNFLNRLLGDARAQAARD
jgi:murein DD-endopeptidase MepM/ murein hydrolase activator NlpD